MRLQDKINEIACRMYERMIPLDHEFNVECGKEIYFEGLDELAKMMLKRYDVEDERYLNPYGYKLYTMFGVANVTLNKDMAPRQVSVEGTTIEDIEVEDILLGRDY